MCKVVVVTTSAGDGDVKEKAATRARRRACMEAGLGSVSQADEDLLVALQLSMSNQ
jgi:hypothetical protein